ncbi:hypothetical protein J3R30DRAFT_1582233 [Lentinula aciculospora]|uniref:Secreted protein n=1 Tax=Lentinula aciculospora TaxID=153920 RepID=A0A9W8ZX10_9AGAR|nr:hypothetical protein J3R30DRAFT_1582233 [Lentinula aciculospora]
MFSICSILTCVYLICAIVEEQGKLDESSSSILGGTRSQVFKVHAGGKAGEERLLTVYKIKRGRKGSNFKMFFQVFRHRQRKFQLTRILSFSSYHWFNTQQDHYLVHGAGYRRLHDRYTCVEFLMGSFRFLSCVFWILDSRNSTQPTCLHLRPKSNLGLTQPAVVVDFRLAFQGC